MELRILGDYHLIKTIGQGPLGTVFLAEHRFLKKQFVLKVLPEELSSDRGFIQRFEDEVRLLATLDHPRLVKMHNVSFAQRQYFLVCDCIVDESGETTNLAQHLASLGRRMDEEEIFSLLQQLAEALDYAHSKKVGHKGLAHRCLKPNNILLGKKNGGVEYYLSDFGLSKIIGLGAVLTRTYKSVADALGIAFQMNIKPGQELYPNPPIETQKLQPLHNSFLQNFAFLAPEQKRMDTSVDYKADIYAFGVLAYFVLTGEFPEGNFEMPSLLVDTRYRWDSLIQVCLQPRPGRRPEILLPLLELVREGKSLSIPMPVEASLIAQREAMAPHFHSPHLERPKADFDPTAIFHVDTGVKEYHPEIKDISNIQPILTEMIVLKGGKFYRGSQDGNRDEMPRHQVVIRPFAIDVHPVTNEQFVRFLEVMGGEKDSHHNDIIRLKDSRIKRSAGKLSIESGYAKHPVVGVTWYGAAAYAKWIGKRLLTEAEWEYAAMGESEGKLYPSGGDIEKNQANFFSSDTTSVMSYVPNSIGIYDMAGNVYEWCHDWYGYNYYETSAQEPENPQGPLQGVYRVLRGGCWKSLKEDLRCSRRHRNNPGTMNGTYGFRCAADVR